MASDVASSCRVLRAASCTSWRIACACCSYGGRRASSHASRATLTSSSAGTIQSGISMPPLSLRPASPVAQPAPQLGHDLRAHLRHARLAHAERLPDVAQAHVVVVDRLHHEALDLVEGVESGIQRRVTLAL